MLLALVLVVAQASAPAVTTATATPSTTYRTQVTARFESFGNTGTLKLWFFPDGNLRGTYTSDDGGGTSSVHGTLDGTKISLDFSGLDRLHIEGTIDHGTIRGSGSKREGSKLWLLVAIPEHPNTSQGDTLHDSASSTRG